ncbi:MAG TPA: glycosyl transferase family 1 [Gallionella sp.]|jgi:glycosyltransferase involved in cell wall biosynthesis|nr:MAG: glycosyl transferase family 1 [Gallionellales bacterium GWA2_54_124]OGT17208.1 MAG: glycosyl transferase family 1 [Gallionellales bacterium RIFOXYD12_FULL_53_10]OGT44827.1 MAG: glycosyl transferase family 1 [Gallionellales bacterium RIFOXYD2_FULL_52_7]HCI51786.1 glycosyl transferase family 1 [Gallionella sp.]
MKILFISDVYFPRVNGVSTSIQTFRHELRQQGHTVHLIAPAYPQQTMDDADIIRIPARGVPMDPEDRFMSYRCVMKQLVRFQNENYDLIHVQTPFVAHYLGIKLAKLLNIPCIETYHTFFEEYLHHYIPLVPKQLMRQVAKQFSRHQGNSLHGMVVPSRPMLQVLKDYGITTPTEVIPTGIEPARFVPGNRESFREKYNIAQNRQVLLFVGRVAFEKNIGFLLGVVSEIRKTLPNILFVIAGEGPALKILMHDVAQMGLDDHVQFIGYLDRNTELNSCYHAADIFIFASRTETQGLVLLEAMAQGTAVVSTAELGTRDVLREGAGVWIAKEELQDFSGKIIKMLDDTATREALGRSGREYAHDWSATRQAERMLTFYKTICKTSG